MKNQKILLIAILVIVATALSLSIVCAGSILRLEKDVPVNEILEMPEDVTFNLYESATVLTPIASQTFAKGEWTADCDFSKFSHDTTRNIVRFKANFTNTEGITSDMDLWVEVELNGVVMGKKEQIRWASSQNYNPDPGIIEESGDSKIGCVIENGSSSSNALKSLNGSDRTLAGDDVIGNEVVGVKGKTLTRSGTGTTTSPYKLSLNLKNDNVWTGKQTFKADTNLPGGIWGGTGKVGIGTTNITDAEGNLVVYGGQTGLDSATKVTIINKSEDPTAQSTRADIGLRAWVPSMNGWQEWDIQARGDWASTGSSVVGMRGLAINEYTDYNSNGRWCDGTSNDICMATRFYIQNGSGNIGVGTTSPSYRLHVNGDIAYTGNIYDISDLRLKENITPLENAMEKVSALRGIYFNLKGESTYKREVGIIAQEVEAVLPEAVSEDSEGYKSVDYSKLTPLLIEAVKSLKARVDALQAEVSELKAQNAASKPEEGI